MPIAGKNGGEDYYIWFYRYLRANFLLMCLSHNITIERSYLASLLEYFSSFGVIFYERV